MPLREDLPTSCPPSSDNIGSPCRVLRLIMTNPPTADDFKDWIDEPWNCDRQANVSECQQKSMSVFESVERGLLKVAKIPRVRQKYSHYAVIDIDCSAGVLAKTGSPGHISWWKCKLWNPMPKVLDIKGLPNV